MCGSGKEQDFFLCNGLVLRNFHGLNIYTNVNALSSQGQTSNILLFGHHIQIINTSMFFIPICSAFLLVCACMLHNQRSSNG
jgi:hypothetical protein